MTIEIIFKLIFIIQFYIASGPTKTPCIANIRNNTPPKILTCFGDILVEIKRPPITAPPVQIACPIQPPNVTPYNKQLKIIMFIQMDS